MTNEQLSKNIKIKEQIDLNNNLIEQALSPNLWTLNNTVANLLKENELAEQVKEVVSANQKSLNTLPYVLTIN